MTSRGGGQRNTRSTSISSLSNLYTLDPQDVEGMENCNDKQLERMKKYIDAVMDVMLTARQKQVVWMYHAEGKSTTEISAALGITPRRARAILDSGMRKLQKHKKIFFKAEQ